MGQYSLTTNPIEEAAITAIVAKRDGELTAENASIVEQNKTIAAQNKERAKERPPLPPLPLLREVRPFRNQDLVATVWASILAGYVKQAADAEAAAVREKLLTITPEQRAQVKELLGV